MRFDTSSRSEPRSAVSILVRLLAQPVTLALVFVLALLSSLPSNASALQLAAAVVDSAVLLGTVLWWDVVGLPARVRRVTRRLGLAHRHPSGRIQSLRCRGVHRIARRHTRLTWHLPPGITLRDVLAQQDAIEQALDGEIVCWMEHGRLIMEVLRERIPDHVDFATFYEQPAPPGKLVIGLGRSHRGPLWTDLGSLPHLLVGGMTGGGKSVFLTQALTHLVLTHHPDRLRLLCIDLKGGIELALFATTPHSLGEVVTTVEGAGEALDSVRTEVDRRLQSLRNAGLRDLDALADIGRPPWPRIVVVVDELAELTVRELGGNPSALAAQKVARGRLGEVARLGRAVGIHLVVCTQRPDAEAVPGQLKANLACTVAFRVRAQVNSLILLENDRAALLPHHPGRAIWAHERLEEFQAIHLAAVEAERLVAGRVAELAAEGAGLVTPPLQNTSGNSESINRIGISEAATQATLSQGEVAR
jgi:DNA segregation ATPase FtsK/SpoIIIE-like protein